MSWEKVSAVIKHSFVRDVFLLLHAYEGHARAKYETRHIFKKMWFLLWSTSRVTKFNLRISFKRRLTWRQTLCSCLRSWKKLERPYKKSTYTVSNMRCLSWKDVFFFFFIFNHTYINYILVGERLVRLIVFCVLEENLIHVCAGILVKFVAAAEDYESDLAVTKNTQLVGFLHHPKLPFVESDLQMKRKLSRLYFVVRMKFLNRTKQISWGFLKFENVFLIILPLILRIWNEVRQKIFMFRRSKWWDKTKTLASWNWSIYESFRE